MANPVALPATERTDPRYQDIELWPLDVSLRALWESQLAAAAAVGPALPAIAAAVAATASRLERGGRLAYAGAGTSARIAAQDGAELAPTFGWPAERTLLLLAGGEDALRRAREGAEDDRDAAMHAVAAGGITENDALLAIAASGRTTFTCACLDAAAARGALTVAVANTADAPLLARAAHPILLATGAEPVAGSTRLGAGTAQKIALNLFSTALMLRLGHVYRGRMVDMRATNAKLKDRAVRMVQELAAADADAARQALLAADWSIKAALLVLRGCTSQEARSLLHRHGRDLRAALAEARG
jgi:N-acetylmuramic acid 6-phosphate etherase